MAGIRAVPLSDAWALRHLTLCARSVSALPAHAQQLVQHLTGNGPHPRPHLEARADIE
jgi:hypothetical protein